MRRDKGYKSTIKYISGWFLKPGTALLGGVSLFSLIFSTPALAQSKNADISTLSRTTDLSSGVTSPSLLLNMPKATDSNFDRFDFDTLTGVIQSPADTLGTGLFNLDTSLGLGNRGSDCYVGDSFCLVDTNSSLDLGNAAQYLSLNNSGLDLELVPRASVRFDDGSESALVGALVRIGDDLREDSDFDSNTWYFFAGADAEALTYRPNSPSRLTQGNFNLQDRIIVGDAQAGLGYRIGDADVSLAYIRREVSGFSNNDSSDDYSYKQDAAALSFTWRR